MNRLLNLMLLCCFSTLTVWAQAPCVNSTLLNGDAESGATPTNTSNNIGLADEFGPIWSSGSTADYYDQTDAASSFTPPIPATGDYVSCWIALNSSVGFREGFQMDLGTAIMPNTGVHTLLMDMACLNTANAWGSIEVGIYGVDNPGGGPAPNPPTSATLPTNMDLFGAANTVLIGVIPHAAADCDPNKVQYSFAINSDAAGFPTGGISHIFVTRSDASPGGGLYMGFDNFCVTPPVRCQNSIIANGDLESGTPTNTSNNIGLADGFSRIWPNGSTADYYNQANAAGGFSLPSPATGDYASCWITHSSNLGFREGFQFELDVALPPNTGTYTLSFDMGCLEHSWGGGVEVGVYGLHNPSNGDAPNPPTTSMLPNNIDLFGAANTMLLQVIPQPTTGCDGTKTVRFVNINTNDANFPAGGMTHVFITRNDGTPGGSAYMAFDNFCLSVNDDCAGNYSINGDLETGVPTNVSNNIGLATGFSSIWASGSTADYYDQTDAASTFTPPTPATGDYASCWIANWAGGGATYREGFTNELVATILPNTGMYEVTFDMACLNGWGISEVAVYGVDNPTNAASSPVINAYNPTNLNLFTPATTVLAGVIPVNSTNCNSAKTMQTVLIDSDASGFPSGGITHLMITHSDNSAISGALYMAFDNFCVHTTDAAPCPTYGGYEAECIEDLNRDGIPDYALTFGFGDDASGSVQLSIMCGGLTTTTFTLNGSGTYSTNLLTGNCSNYSITYTILDANGNVCDQRSIILDLPDCPIKGCICDEDFVNNVRAGFTYLEDCPDDFFTPRQLNPCDQVEWYLNGSLVGTTQGNATFSMPHIENPSVLCMTVTRNDVVNQVACRETFCFEVNPRISCDRGPGGGHQVGFSRLNVQPNPAQQQATVTWSTENVSDQLNISVYNLQGVRVLETVTVNGHNGNLVLDLSTLSSGVYYIRAEGEGYAAPPVKLLKQ